MKLQPQSLQLKAAAVLQGGCSVDEIRKHIPIACIEEMARNPCFRAFTDYLGAPRMISPPASTCNGHGSHTSSQPSTRMMHNAHSAHCPPITIPQSSASAAAAAASISPALECTRHQHEAEIPHRDAPVEVRGLPQDTALLQYPPLTALWLSKSHYSCS